MRFYVLPVAMLAACQALRLCAGDAYAHGLENAIGPTALPAPVIVTPEEVIVSAPEPRYVAPTLRDRIGRIWAPVHINGKGPFRLVLDTGANRSVVTHTTAQRLGGVIETSRMVQLHGVTGKAQVPTIEVESVEVGDLLLDERKMPVVQDV